MSVVESSGGSSRIAAVRGLRSEPVQPILWQFAQDLKSKGVRVAGVVEFSRCASSEGACDHLAVRDLTSGALIPISQNLGPGSTVSAPLSDDWSRFAGPLYDDVTPTMEAIYMVERLWEK